MTRTKQRAASLAFSCVLTACGYPALVPLVDGSSDSAIDIDAKQTERMMLVLIDMTGSMMVSRVDTATRFEAAQKMAESDIQIEAATPEGLTGVAIYTFHDIGIDAKTMGFVTPATARNAIAALVVGGGASPLAGSICDTIDILVASGDIARIKMLEIYLDGGENNTSPSHPCYGSPSNGDFPPFDTASWQNKVFIKATNSSVRIGTTLFAASVLASAHYYAPFALSDPTFFSTLARSTGGQFRQIFDDKPLP